jgi:hypothetical protein
VVGIGMPYISLTVQRCTAAQAPATWGTVGIVIMTKQSVKPATARKLGNAVARSKAAQAEAQAAQAAVQAQAPAQPAPQAPAPDAGYGTATPAPQAPATPPAVVAVRGGLAIAAVRLTGKVYRVGATHNAGWWNQCTQAVAAGGGSASVADLVKAGVPAIFVGYVVRRGYMAPVSA